MPALALDNLNESLLGYWMKLTVVTRDMLTMEPLKNRPMVINGQRIPKDQDQERKL